MSELELIDKYYVEKSWTRYPAIPFRMMAALNPSVPEKYSDAKDCPRTFTSDSGAAKIFEEQLGRVTKDKRLEVVNTVFIWDYELLAADSLDLAINGGSLMRLSEEWNGHKAGSLVMHITIKPKDSREFMDLALVHIVQNND